MENMIKKWLFARPKEECVKEANAIYQVREYEGEIWLTFNGEIVCPMGMFKEETIAALEMIREMYVRRNATDVMPP